MFDGGRSMVRSGGPVGEGVSARYRSRSGEVLCRACFNYRTKDGDVLS